MNSLEGARISGTAFLKCTGLPYQDDVTGCSELFDFQGNSEWRMHFHNVEKVLLILPKVVRYLELSIRDPKKVFGFVQFIVRAIDVGTGKGALGHLPPRFCSKQRRALSIPRKCHHFLKEK